MGLSATITGLVSNTGYGVQVRAVNGEGPGPWSMTPRAMTRTAELTVAFGGSNYPVTESETATITVTVTPVADRDITVTVSMTGDGGTFADGAGNALTLTIARGDRSYNFQIVTAADAGGSELTLKLVTTAVKVSVGTPSIATVTIDEPPNSPPTFNEIGPADRSVPENSPAGTNVGTPFTVTDPDDGDTLAYSLTGPGSDKFAVDANGQITVAADARLDFEDTPFYILTLGVKDNKDAAGNADTTKADDDTIAVTITVTNVNEAPVFNETGPAERSVPENSPADTNVGEAFTATDPEDDTLVYSLTGPGSERFTVGADGQITVAAEASIDFEDTPSYTLTLGVTDNKDAADNAALTEAYDDTITVTITVTNLNEAPIFDDRGPAERSVPENSPADTTVGAPFKATKATDPERL